MLTIQDVNSVIKQKIQVARDTAKDKTLWFYPSDKSYIVWAENEVVWCGYAQHRAIEEYNAI